MLRSAVVVLLLVSATTAKEVVDTPETPTFRRKLGGGSGSSSPSPPPKPKEPTFFVYQAPATPAACSAAIDASQKYLEDSNSDKKTNWNDALFGHAKFVCLEPMIKGKLQYEKAISYAWCVYPHCQEKCPGAECPVHGTVAKCQSAVKNWLGYAERKKAAPDLSEAQKYYDEAIAAWPTNCGALGYRAELELQKGSRGSAMARLSDLCSHSACRGHAAVREAATTFWKHAYLGRQNVPAACDWALGLDVPMSMAARRGVFVWLVPITWILVSVLVSVLE